MVDLLMTIDIEHLFALAERTFAAGRLDETRLTLRNLDRLTDHPSVHHLTALVEKRLGNLSEAETSFRSALRLTPDDPQINSNYANLLDTLGRHGEALSHYDRAISVAPDFMDAQFNRALMMQRLGELTKALSAVEALLAGGPVTTRLHLARASLLRDLDKLGPAAEAFDAALALDPSHRVALHGRARIALERGEADAVSRYQRALAMNTDDPDVNLGYAHALEYEGLAQQGIAHLARFNAAHPEASALHSALAEMRWEAGAGVTFTQDLNAAIAVRPADPALRQSLVGVLAGAGLFAPAADAALVARSVIGDDPVMTLLEATYASEAGEVERADRLFAALPVAMEERLLPAALHLLRTGEIERAAKLVDAARAARPDSIFAWALTSLVWRMTDHSRAAWLSEQPGLIARLSLDFDPVNLGGIASLLRSLHRTRAYPIGQSLRGGTQTRGRLFERLEPEIRLLFAAIQRAVGRYWSALPAADPDHPLLRHRATGPRIEGSWSVRLINGGFHVAHFHPRGIVSSACYLTVPEAQAPMEGWLEIGGAPASLSLPLEPLTRVRPEPGTLALFPSYLYHGTRPFTAGERLTSAFDVVPG